MSNHSNKLYCLPMIPVCSDDIKCHSQSPETVVGLGRCMDFDCQGIIYLKSYGQIGIKILIYIYIYTHTHIYIE